MSFLAVDQLAMPTELDWSRLFTQGTAIEGWWITTRSWQTIQSKIAKKPPRKCTTWRGLKGEQCGECRWWTDQVMLTKSGYPKFRIRLPDEKPIFLGQGRNRRRLYKGKQVAVGRIVIAWHRGSIPCNMVAGHTCPCGEDPRCLNPDHLEPMTPLENHLRIRLNGHTDPSTLNLVDGVLNKVEQNLSLLTEQEYKIYQAIQAGLLERTDVGEIVVHDPYDVIKRRMEEIEPWRSPLTEEERLVDDSREIPF